MKLFDKIVLLRKKQGLSQEALAEKLNVSRQAVSRWEMGTAMPDAENILRLSEVFGVSADYLLHDDYSDDDDLPKVKEVREDAFRQVMFYLIALEVMILLIQFMTTVILENLFFALTSFLLFGAVMAGFAYGQKKHAASHTPQTRRFCRRFYKISLWLGLYFPVRFLGMMVRTFFPTPQMAFECVVLCVYLAVGLCGTLSIDKHALPKQ